MNFTKKINQILMLETKCPYCGSEAYIGLNKVECTNPQCRHYVQLLKDPDICPGCGESFDLDMRHEDECPWETAQNHAMIRLRMYPRDADDWADKNWLRFKHPT